MADAAHECATGVGAAAVSHQIHGRLFEVPFDQLERRRPNPASRRVEVTIPYTALSYHWGDESDDIEYIVLHKSGSRFFQTVMEAQAAKKAKSAADLTKPQRSQPKENKYPVKINLYRALKALQHHQHTIVMWIDALCINQDDPVEKQAQLAKINLVYELAPKVLIWLGPADSAGQCSTHTDEMDTLLLSRAARGLDLSIRVQGFEVDTITWRTIGLSGGLVPKAVMVRLAPTFMNKVQEHYPCETADVPDNVWKCLVAERGAGGANPPPPTYPRACKDIMSNHLSGNDLNIRELLRNANVLDYEKEFLSRIEAVTCNRSYFEAGPELNDKEQVEDRLHGFGPEGLEVNDVVCILFGCTVPVILRPKTNTMTGNLQYYKLVGECYLYGLMDGEAVVLNEKYKGGSTREFRIF
ncbi:hypothetical protein DOTSEDRAFT_83665 [Dothistroma septosporum NZE10]|uniref:Heterokaryon incompatibility domain-containing protein n=1 Tax=Dothistroma septosporum (strain NZE10 / CBS 128990) TaxID=675120 RepID=M2YJJ6_DOTSN|nr:hypothetical protein DOTSEDRAFT_83665 [Dothistroma septosporum NZE10]